MPKSTAALASTKRRNSLRGVLGFLHLHETAAGLDHTGGQRTAPAAHTRWPAARRGCGHHTPHRAAVVADRAGRQHRARSRPACRSRCLRHIPQMEVAHNGVIVDPCDTKNSHFGFLLMDSFSVTMLKSRSFFEVQVCALWLADAVFSALMDTLASSSRSSLYSYLSTRLVFPAG